MGRKGGKRWAERPAEAGRSGLEAGAAQRGRARDRGSSVQLAIRELRTPTPFSYPSYRRLWVCVKVSQRHLHQKNHSTILH